MLIYLESKKTPPPFKYMVWCNAIYDGYYIYNDLPTAKQKALELSVTVPRLVAKVYWHLGEFHLMRIFSYTGGKGPKKENGIWCPVKWVTDNNVCLNVQELGIGKEYIRGE